jgi:hypothetical protein
VIIDRGRLVRHAPLAELTNGTSDLEDVYFKLTRQEHR